jgi:hypothetical protein
MYNGSTILLCVTIFVIHKQCLIRAHCSIVTVIMSTSSMRRIRGGLKKRCTKNMGLIFLTTSRRDVVLRLTFFPNMGGDSGGDLGDARGDARVIPGSGDA